MHTTGNDIDIKVNGITICYDDLGKGDYPIIFVHGFPLNKSSWEPQLNSLKEKYRVIAYDIRGFGKSSMGEDEFSIELLADDLVKFMDALQIEKAIVCGLSMGGYIVLNAVSRYSRRFRAIILSGTQCTEDSPEQRQKRRKTIEQIEDNGLNTFVSDFVKNSFSKETLLKNTSLTAKITAEILKTPPEVITKTIRAVAKRQESCIMLKDISVPSLILYGTEDKVIPVEQSEFLFYNIPHSVLHSITHAAHLSNLDEADKFNSHLHNFLSDQKITKTHSSGKYSEF